jgi:hypothetical protein
MDGRPRDRVEAQQRVQGIAALVGAIRALASLRSAEDVGGVEIQDDRSDAGRSIRGPLHQPKRLVQLTDVAQREAAQPRPGSLRRRHGEAAHGLLRSVRPRHRQVVQAPSTQRYALRDRRHELPVGQATSTPLHRQAGIGHRHQPDNVHHIAQQHRAGMSGNRTPRRSNSHRGPKA